MATTPTYRARKGYDQAIVTLQDSLTRKRKDFWLGEYGSSESRERYHRVVAAWEANGRRWPNLVEAGVVEPPGVDGDPGGPTVTVVIAEYWKWAESYYSPTESATLGVGLRLLRAHHGSTPASAFGPVKLRALREAMIDGDPMANPPREPWSRGYVNQHVQRIKRMFKWAAAQEMIPASVPRALETLENLKRGRTRAKEGKKVLPVPVERIAKVKPFLSRQLQAVIDVQLLTGARPGEALAMRPCDIDMSEDVWKYRPATHKTMHQGADRVIFLGPRAQDVIAPFLNRDDDAYLFSPAEAEVERRAAAHEARKTPISTGNAPGTNVKAEPKKQPGGRYSTQGYLVAIYRACDRAFPPTGDLAKRDGETAAEWHERLTPEQAEELRVWQKEHRWHPHQLRHNAATEFRKEFGLEAAQLVLGHSSAVVTDAVYAERDHGRVEEVVRRVG